jgi:hypothetical protein
VNALTHYHDLKQRGVHLKAEGETLRVDAPAGELTDEDRVALIEFKSLLLRFLGWERRTLEEAERLGCVARWLHYPTWIELHDPTTGEWYEVRASECLPGVVAEADKHREQGGAA